MPKKNPEVWYAYGGTVTFQPYFTFEKKVSIIKGFKQMFENLLWGSTNDYYLSYTIEYHKVEQQDDLQAPHIHFILYCNKPINKMYFRFILDGLKKIGRSQFYLMTNLKRIQYENYIKKDLDKNNLLNTQQGYYHEVETWLTPRNTLWGEHEEEYIDDDI